MDRENGLIYTVALINQLNGEFYNLKNFKKDSECLVKLLVSIDMMDIEENLDLVKQKCLQELSLNTVIDISVEDKKYILKYL